MYGVPLFPPQERELTAEEAVELERERDRDERDALVERMMDKDKSKTKQMELGGLTPAQVRVFFLPGGRSWGLRSPLWLLLLLLLKLSVKGDSEFC